MPVQSRPSSTTSSSRGRGRGGGGGVVGSASTLPYISDTSSSQNLSSTLTPQQYLQRMLDLQQMDLQSAVDQMRTLLTFYPQRVYKMAYYRKQTKNHWARDDPAFCFLQIIMLVAFSIAYGFAFRVSSFSAILGFVVKSILIHWLGFGVVMASVGRLIANQHLMITDRSANHVRQDVEWLYAFDIHCNAFVPLFVLLCEYWSLVRCHYTADIAWNNFAYIFLSCKSCIFSPSCTFYLLMVYERSFRLCSILPVAGSLGNVTSFIRMFEYFIRCIIWMVFLHYSFRL